MGKPRFLICGDSHHPWADREVLRAIYQIAEEFRPTHIVQIGDLLDFYSFSRYPKSLNIMTPKEELEAGRSDAAEMWIKLQKASPKAKCWQLLGNHCERPMKKLMASFPEAEGLISISSLYNFKGVETLASERDELIIGKLCFMHGFRSKLGDHALHNRMSTICGHSHRGGVFYTRLGKEILFELNVGFIGMEESKALSYTKQRQISHWTTGVGLLDEWGPRFVPIF